MIERNEYLKSLISFKDKNLIKVVTGIRRCGKSTMFELFQSYLTENGIEQQQIISINLEDGDYRHIDTSEKLYQFVFYPLVYGVYSQLSCTPYKTSHGCHRLKDC